MATLGSKSVGSKVKLNVNGVATNFIVVHQGLPSADYDSSCNGTWLLMEKIYVGMSGCYNVDHYTQVYYATDIGSYLRNDFPALLDSDILEVVHKAKIPITQVSNNAPSGAYDYTTKGVFLLSKTELGYGTDDYTETEGAPLSYFTSDSRRIAYNSNGNAAAYWTRTVRFFPNYNNYYSVVGTDGKIASANMYYSRGVRPAMILPSTLSVLDDGTVSTNTAPVISGSNGSLGTFTTTPPTASYKVTDVDGDSVTVTIKLNGTTKKTHTVSLGTAYTYTPTASEWAALALGTHTITITASDGEQSVTRTYTCVKANTAPTISGSDGSLGTFSTNIPTASYTINDAEGNSVTATVKLDNTTQKTHIAALGTDYSFTFTEEEWLKVTNGSHTITITASDGTASTTRTYTFTKSVTSLSFTLETPLEASEMPTCGIENLTAVIPTGATLKVEACNNGFDASPTWEDVTANVLNNAKFYFANTTKTASKWGYNVRVTVERGSATGDCYVTSMAGFFE